MRRNVAQGRAYSFDDFMDACRTGTPAVYALNTAIDEAVRFKLHSEEAILDFIGSGGCEKLRWKNTKPWDENPTPELEILVDSYRFSSGNDEGYIAFLRKKNGCWLLKSFKMQDPEIEEKIVSVTGDALKQALIKAGYDEQE